MTIGTLCRLIPGVIILGLIVWALRLEDLRGRWQHQYEAEHVARLADRETYQRAQAEAEAKNKAQVQRIQQQQQEITENADNRYNADLARLRAELGRLLAQDGTAKGSPDKPGASGLPNAAGQPGQTGTVCIPTRDYVSGAETELQLDALIQWVLGQSKVDPNK